MKTSALKYLFVSIIALLVAVTSTFGQTDLKKVTIKNGTPYIVTVSLNKAKDPNNLAGWKIKSVMSADTVNNFVEKTADVMVNPVAILYLKATFYKVKEDGTKGEKVAVKIFEQKVGTKTTTIDLVKVFGTEKIVKPEFQSLDLKVVNNTSYKIYLTDIGGEFASFDGLALSTKDTSVIKRKLETETYTIRVQYLQGGKFVTKIVNKIVGETDAFMVFTDNDFLQGKSLRSTARLKIKNETEDPIIVYVGKETQYMVSLAPGATSKDYYAVELGDVPLGITTVDENKPDNYQTVVTEGQRVLVITGKPGNYKAGTSSKKTGGKFVTVR